MSTICADELLNGAGEPRAPDRRRETPAHQPRVVAAGSATGRSRAPATRRRFEDFEVRASRLGDLLGGQVFPRVF